MSHIFRRTTILTVGLIAFLAGIGLAKTHIVMDESLVLLALILCAVMLRRRNMAAIITVLFLGIMLGWWRGSMYMPKLALHESLHGERVVLIGEATDDALYGPSSQLEFTLGKVQVIEPTKTPLVGSLMVRGFGTPAVYRGDTVRVEGKLFPTLGNNLGRTSFARIEVLQRGTSPINEFRREFAAGMQSSLPEPAASFGLGILIGQRNTLPESTDTQLRHVGLTHIIAVSGYNLTIIVLACRRLLAGRSKFQATAACVGLIGVFLLITGSSPPIVRASIVSLLGITAWYFGRQVKPLLLLLVSAVITVAANPVYLWSSVSWYLSFLAFFGVLVLAPLITKRFIGDKEPKMFSSILIESACASLLTLPYILYIFGEMSLVSLPANLLVIPLIPLAMILALIAGLGGMLTPIIAGWLAWPAKTLLTYMLDVAHLLSRTPNAFIENIGFPLHVMLMSYAVIIFVCIVLWHKTRTKYGTITDERTG